MGLKNSKLLLKIRKIKISELNKTILKSGFWILFGTVISKVLLLISSIVIIRFVDKSVYGEFGMIKSTINMFTVFAGLGLGLTTTKFIAQYKTSDVEKTARIIGLSNLFSIILCVIVGLVFILFSSQLAFQINAPNLTNSLKISALVLVFSGLNGIQGGILGGFEKFKVISINSIIASIFSFVFQILGAKFFGINGIIIGFGINFVILYFLNYVSIQKLTKNVYNIRIYSKDNFKELKLIWQFSIPALLSGLMVSPVVWITNSFLVTGNNGYNEMADFDIANQWRTTVLFIPVALSQIALPMLSSTIDKNDYNRILVKNLFLNFVISLAIFIVLVSFSPIILSLYGEDYSSARVPLIIMLFTTILISINNIFGNAIASKDRMWLGFFTNLVWGFVLVGLAVLFVTYLGYGALGLSYAYLLSYVFHTILQGLLWKFKVKE